MPMFEGTFNIEEIYKGDVTVPEAYRGPEQVFPFAPLDPVVVSDGNGIVLKGGHTYKVLTSDLVVEEIEVSEDTYITFSDNVRLEQGSGSNKATFTYNLTASCEYFGETIPLTNSYNNAVIQHYSNMGTSYFRIINGLSLIQDPSFGVTHTFGSIPTSGEAATFELNLQLTFSSPVRLSGYYLARGADSSIKSIPSDYLPEGITNGNVYVGYALAPFAGAPGSPGVPSIVDTAPPLYTPRLKEYSYTRDNIVIDSANGDDLDSDNIADSVEKYFYAHNDTDPAVGYSSYGMHYRCATDWSRYSDSLAGKTCYLTGGSTSAADGKVYLDIRAAGFYNQALYYPEGMVPTYAYIGVDAMNGESYSNDPVYLFGRKSDSGEIQLSGISYEVRAQWFGNTFSDAEYPPVAYISYTNNVGAAPTYTLVRNIATCITNPAGVVS